jgi:hypothetical protein
LLTERKGLSTFVFGESRFCLRPYPAPGEHGKSPPELWNKVPGTESIGKIRKWRWKFPLAGNRAKNTSSATADPAVTSVNYFYEMADEMKSFACKVAERVLAPGADDRLLPAYVINHSYLAWSAELPCQFRAA